MSQQNLSVVEQHVEKMALGLGGLILVVGLVLAFSGGDVAGNPDAVSKLAAAKLSELNSETESPMLAAEKPKLALVVPDVATKAVQQPVTLPGLDLLGSSQTAVLAAIFPQDFAPWRPGTGGANVITDAISEQTFTDLPAPTQPRVVSARGVSGQGFIGVQVQTDLDTKAILTRWWPMYKYMRENTQAQARRIGVLDPDFSKMERDFDRRWRADIYAVDVQMQRFDPKTGWERDAQGKELWTRIDLPWGKASSINWIERVLALEADDGKKLPTLQQRKDNPQVQKLFNRTVNEMFQLRNANYDEIIWPVPPSENKGLKVFRPNGEPADQNKWLAPPKMEIRSSMMMTTKSTTVDDVDPFADPTDPTTKTVNKKEDPQPVKDNIRQLEPSLTQRLGDSSGVVSMSAFVTANISPDALLQPGETYRFRTRVVLLNPALGWQEQAPGKLDNRMFVSTAWSEASEPVTIPELTRFFVLSSDKIGSGPTASVKPVIQIFRWYNGEWYSTRGIRVVPGTVIRPDRREDFIRPPSGMPWPLEQPKNKEEAKAKLNAAIAMFDTGCLLLEARESNTILDREPNAAAIKNPGRADYFTGTRGNKTVIVFVDRHGVVRTQKAAYDKTELENFLKAP